jgi:hypothetical protein
VVRNAGAFAVVVRHEIRFFALRNERPYFLNLVCFCFRINDVELGHGGERGVNVFQRSELGHMPECGHAHVFVGAQMRHDGAAFGGGLHDEQDLIFISGFIH